MPFDDTEYVGEFGSLFEYGHYPNGILSIQKGDWKLITSSGSGGSWSEPRGELADLEQSEDSNRWINVQLYNLAEDSQEKVNLAEKYPEKVNELINILALDIRNGRSTPETSMKNNDPEVWRTKSWLSKINNVETP